MNRPKEPLYRKEKKTGLSRRGHIQTGQEYRWQRNTKEFKNSEATHEAMNPGKYGYDYTPLFKFLLSKVGKPWEDTFREAQARLKGQDYGDKPIWWMVAENESEISEYGSVWCGENSAWSQLKIDSDGILQVVKPNAKGHIGCYCCTHTFNGKVLDPNVKENWYSADNFEYCQKFYKQSRKKKKEHKKFLASIEYNFKPKPKEDVS